MSTAEETSVFLNAPSLTIFPLIAFLGGRGWGEREREGEWIFDGVCCGFQIPAVYEQLSSERVLLMEFVRGVKLKNLDLLPDVRGDRVARTLLEAFAQMIFVNGFVHGDPHQGNLLVTPSTENRK